MVFAPQSGPLASLPRATGVVQARDGAKIGYEVFAPSAPGVPLLMVMGLSGLYSDWYPLPQLLAVDGDENQAPVRPIIILDNRGMGKSSFPPDWEEDLTIDHMAFDVIDVLHHLQIKRTNLLGFSMGGYVVQHVLANGIAESQGQQNGLWVEGIQINKVLLTATMPRAVGSDMNPGEMAKLMASTRDQQEAKRRATRYLIELQYSPEWVANPSNQKVLNARIEAGLEGNRSQRIIGAQLSAILSGEDQSEALAKIPTSIPVALVHGEKDRMVHPIGGQLLQQAIPHIQRLVHPEIKLDFGHFWYDLPHTASWARLLGQFLDDGPQARL